jgi:RNA polymerase II subunit A small phosphatase-like protein
MTPMRELSHTTNATAAAPTASTTAATGRSDASVAGTSKDADMVANTSRTGAKLPRDETADVLSGAVVPPGADGSTPRRSRKSSAAGGEGGAGVGPAEDGGPAEGEESEDEFMQEDDEDERIIAQGGMGIPIGEVGCSFFVPSWFRGERCLRRVVSGRTSTPPTG